MTAAPHPDSDGGTTSVHGESVIPFPVRGGRLRVVADAALDRQCALLPQTDLGNAERFRLRFGSQFRFSPDLGWLHWDGRRWKLLRQEKDQIPGEVMQAVYGTARGIANEAALVRDSGCKDDLPQGSEEEQAALDFIIKRKGNEVQLFSDTLLAHAKSSEGKSRLQAIPVLASAFPDVLALPDAFDADRMAINVLNGTIRLEQCAAADGGWRVRLDPHDPEDLITKIADVVYDPTADCPTYDAFFAKVMPSEDDRRFLHQWAGLSATGDTTYHKMAFFWGKGRNGKSTWVEAFAGLLGEYSLVIKFDTFLEQSNKRKGSDATPDLARLPGVRFLRTSEPEKGAKLNEALIKEATGGEPMSARHLNKGFFDFLPSFKLTAQGNYRPKITGTDDGIWGRVRLVPWTVRVPDSEIDVTLPQKLRAERSGIFNRLLAGLIDLKRNGLVESANVLNATSKYREASDQLGRFLIDCTIDKPGGRVKSSHLFDLFTAWAKASGGGEWQSQGFAKAMEDRGYERLRSNGVWWLEIEATVTVHDIESGAFGGHAASGGTAVQDALGVPPADDDGGLPDWASDADRDDAGSFDPFG